MGNNVPTGSKILKHGPPSAVSNSETDMGPTMINKSKPTDIHQSAVSPRNPDVVKPALTFKTVPREPKSEVFEGLDYLSDESPEAFYKGKIPVVFKWTGAGTNIFVSGSYDNWTSKTALVKSMENFYSIIELPEGFHQYKFEVDGTWCCDTNEPKIANTMGSENNYIAVKRSDFEVFEALTSDAASMLSTTHSYQDERKQRDTSGRPPSPPGEYSKQMPDLSGTNMYNVYRAPVPPTLPPLLQHGVLNKDVSMSNEPDLLPMPNTCTLNHVYALSIKDGLMVLSQGRRYRKKFVTTLFYRPI